MPKKMDESEGFNGRPLNDLNADDADDIDHDHDIDDDGFDHLEDVDDDDPGRAEG